MESYYKRKRSLSNDEENSTPEPEPLQLALVEAEQEQPNQNEEPEQPTNEPIIFRGIEFLERDLGKRPQIWQYPENVRDEVRRAYLQLGPMQPKLEIYKPSGPQGHQRRFQFSWFKDFSSWLEYSESKSCAFCFRCFLCSKNIKKEVVLKRVNNGNKCAFLAHVGFGPCSQHNNADETCDASKREQMTLVFRFVDADGVSQERFFQLVHVRNTKALTLKSVLCDVLAKQAFDIKNLRGQGYDGASNMKGEFNGLQALFLKDCPYAYYVHCYVHRLQLALVAASRDVVPVSQFFQKLLFIINTVDSSSKRHDELQDEQVVEMEHLLQNDQLETGQGANQIRALKRPGDTRWGSHLGSISSLMHIFNAVSSVLQTIASDATAGSNRADGDTAFNYLTSFEFVFVLCMMREILGISEELGKALQKKNHRT